MPPRYWAFEKDVHLKLKSGLTFVFLKAILSTSPAASTGVTALELALNELFPKYRDREKAKRLAENLASETIDVLTPWLEGEVNRGSELDPIPVATAIEETLKLLGISKEEVAAASYSQSWLVAKLKSVDPAKYLLSPDQDALYRRCLELVSTALVDAMKALPDFPQTAGIETLRRLEELQKESVPIIIDRLQELAAIQQNSLDRHESAGRDYEADYRHRVVRRFDRLRLIGVDSDDFRQDHRLSVAYVSLTVYRPEVRIEAAPSARQLIRKLNQRLRKEDAGARLDATEFLSRSDRLAIIGPAGSGKTTLLQWIAVTAAKSAFVGELESWNGLVPFFVRLREFSIKPMPQLEDLCDAVDTITSSVRPRSWVFELFRSNRALLLIDGFDELSQEQSQKAYDWLADILDRFPAARVVVTARPRALKSDWLGENLFEPAVLDEMSKEQVGRFTEKWYEALAAQTEDFPAEDVAPIASALMAQIASDTSLTKLATTPLFCAMICALHNARGDVPRNRIDLYEACIGLLLQRRDQKRGILAGQLPDDFTGKQRDIVAQRIAAGMTLETTEIQFVTTVLSTVEDFLSDQSVQRVTAKEVFDFLVERASLLRRVDEDAVEFTHRSFQEYLSAKRFIHSNQIDKVLQLAGSPRYGDVAILAAGLGNQTSADQILTRLLDRVDSGNSKGALAIAAITAFGLVDEPLPGTKERVAKLAKSLHPPMTRDAALALAEIGENALPYLVNLAYPPQVARNCITALSQIGSKAAFELLKGYADSADSETAEHLAAQWDRFADLPFAEDVLSKCTRLRRLRLNARSANALAGIDRLTSIERVELITPGRSFNYGLLSALPNLRHLRIVRSSGLQDLRVLGRLPLSTLELYYCKDLYSFKAVNLLAGLEVIEAHGCLDLYDIAGIEGLPRLRVLKLFGCRKVSDIGTIVQCKGLKAFSLKGTAIRRIPDELKRIIRANSPT